jgi:hypothetical protein
MRNPRRSFAAPFVITMVGAAGSAGFTSCNPPARQPQPDPLIGKNPPAPDPQPDTAGTGERRWTVYKQGQDCFAGTANFDCPKPATPGGPVPTCNPPPPMKYACPDNVSLDHPIEVAQWNGEQTCHVVPAPIDCPKGAMCNPPPPIQVACPTP